MHRGQRNFWRKKNKKGLLVLRLPKFEINFFANGLNPPQPCRLPCLIIVCLRLFATVSIKMSALPGKSLGATSRSAIEPDP